jgi:hypothetical protein
MPFLGWGLSLFVPFATPKKIRGSYYLDYVYMMTTLPSVSLTSGWLVLRADVLFPTTAAVWECFLLLQGHEIYG